MHATQGIHPTPRKRRARATAIAGFCTLLAAAALSPTGAAAGSSKRVVSKAPNAALGTVVLTNRRGLTLYSLSVERHGRFICKGSCLSLWHPLVVRKGIRPTGPVKLGTVRRPDGRIQVTYKGRPLYSFGGDSKKGEANGEGFKDVGTWHAATVRQAGTSEPPPPASSPYPESPYMPYPPPEGQPSSPESPPPSENPYPEYPY